MNQSDVSKMLSSVRKCGVVNIVKMKEIYINEIRYLNNLNTQIVNRTNNIINKQNILITDHNYIYRKFKTRCCSTGFKHIYVN